MNPSLVKCRGWVWCEKSIAKPDGFVRADSYDPNPAPHDIIAIRPEYVGGEWKKAEVDAVTDYWLEANDPRIRQYSTTDDESCGGGG